MKEQVYEDSRGAEAMAPFHAWARTHEPGWTYTAVRVLLTPVMLLWFRTQAIDLENVPAAGAVILAPNHFSNWDHFFLGVHLKRRIRFMTKSQFFGGNPFVSYLFRVAGHFPVRRGRADGEAFVTANAILDKGGCVGIYAEGGRSRTGGLGEPRPGVGRLALESGAPVVAVAIVRSGRRVQVRFGEPASFAKNAAPTREEQVSTAGQIFDRVRDLYSRQG